MSLTTGPAKLIGAAAALCFAVAAVAAPVLARDAYVVDDAGLFSSATVSRLDGEIGDFQRTTGKEIVVVTQPTLAGKTLDDAAQATFTAQQVNGVLFYFAKAEKKDLIVGDQASKAFFPPGTFTTIHDAMRGYLRDGDADQAIQTGVSLVLDQYRSHQRGLTQSTAYSAPLTSHRTTSIGGGMSLIWLAIILFAGFIIIRGIFRAIAGPRVMPPGYGPGMGGPGMGPGYGGGYGGGGGGFFSGLLGGLGGAFIGNELFGNRGGNFIGGGNPVGGLGDGSGGGGDNAGWQPDAGQADMGNAGGGSWGDSGGGFDGGGGGDGGGW
jgi:uncharacterized protein